MTPQSLKASILQLAIQGKLVEQRPEEGTAEELYRRIQAEKQRLVKPGKLKKEKPLPEITEDEKPFNIPESWKLVRLGNVLREVIVPMRDKPSFSKSGIPWCRIEDRDGFLLNGSKSNQFVSRDTIQAMNLKVLPVGTVLSACTGGSIGTIVVNTVECCTNQTFNGLYCSSGLYNWYLFWFLTTQFNALRKVGTGTTMAYVSQNKSKMMVLPLPPLAEQKRIVAKIEELLPLIDRYAQAWSKLEDFNKRFPGDMQKSLLQMAIQGKLVEQRPEEGTGEELYRQIQAEKQRLVKAGKLKKEKPLPEIAADEIPFEIPESWKWAKIGSILNLQAGKNIKSEFIYQSSAPDHKYPCYGGNGCRGYVAEYNRSGHYALIGRQGALCGNINYANGQFYATEHAVVVEQFAETSVLWCGLFLQALNLNRYATATAQPGLAVANINQVLIPLPPLAEQKRIVAKLEELLPLCERLK